MVNARCLLLCLVAIHFPVAGKTIHQWVDADGVTHFSDSPPSTAVDDVKTLELADNLSSADNPAADYYSITNQWQRLRDERDRNAELRLERQRLRAEERAAAVEPQPYSQPQYLPVYGGPLFGRRARLGRDPFFDRPRSAPRERNTRRVVTPRGISAVGPARRASRAPAFTGRAIGRAGRSGARASFYFR